MHARLSSGERPQYFWNGYFYRTMGGTILSSNFQRASANLLSNLRDRILAGLLLLVPTKAVIDDYSPVKPNTSFENADASFSG